MTDPNPPIIVGEGSEDSSDLELETHTEQSI